MMDAVGKTSAPDPERYLHMLYTRLPQAASRPGRVRLRRMSARQQHRDPATTWETLVAQYDAVCK